jgi:beta-lactamase class A
VNNRHLLCGSLILLVYLALFLPSSSIQRIEAKNSSGEEGGNLYFRDAIAAMRDFTSRRMVIIDLFLQTIHSVNSDFQSFEKEFPGTSGTAFHDIKSGWSGGKNNALPFPAASAIKVPIIVAMYDEARRGRLNLDEQITVTEADKVGGSGTLKDRAGERFSIRELARMMITKSDNTATDILLKKLTMGRINSRMKELGLRSTSIERTILDFDALDRGLDNVMSPSDMQLLFMTIYNERKDAYGQEMMEMLCHVERKDMLPAFIPASIPVAHKTGELAGTVVDGGIILHRIHPYILCLMGRDVVDREKAIAAFARLSKSICCTIDKLAREEEK